MADINQVTLSGHVGQDPEIKIFEGGSQKASFSVATTKKWVTKEGEKKETTQWHRVEAWAGLAKLSEYIKKGNAVTVIGELQYETYTDKDGVERNITKINAKEMFISGSASSAPRTQASAPAPLPPAAVDDDLPF